MRGTARGVTVYDDFAHHPTAIATTVDGLRRAVGAARILAVLEPRSNTMKLGAMKDALPGSLAGADRTFCYAAKLGWDRRRRARAARREGASCTTISTRSSRRSSAEARAGDHVLVMSNGGFGGIHDKLLRRSRALTSATSRRDRARRAAAAMSAPTIVYLHGFNSSPQSVKGQHPRARGGGARAIRRASICRSSHHRPAQAMRDVCAWIDREAPDGRDLTLIGSSLGGFYATWLAEHYGARAVLINPAIRPYEDLRPFLGRQRNLYTGEEYEVTPAHFDELAALAVPRITRPERYFLLVRTGDEVLDWREAVAFYAGAFQYVAGGGDHGWTDFGDEVGVGAALRRDAAPEHGGILRGPRWPADPRRRYAHLAWPGPRRACDDPGSVPARLLRPTAGHGTVGFLSAGNKGGTMNIGKALIVDDSKVVQFKLKRMLEARGLGVDTASSGHEALDFLKSHAPDVIFMDFMMPDMDGYEVTGIITANPETAAIPVIMCTGHDTPQDRARARENGASGFVTKPVDEPTLDAVLDELQDGVDARCDRWSGRGAGCRRRDSGAELAERRRPTRRRLPHR